VLEECTIFFFFFLFIHVCVYIKICVKKFVPKINYKAGKTKKLDSLVFCNKIDRYALKHRNMILQYV
jgi:hypothetical protein